MASDGPAWAAPLLDQLDKVSKKQRVESFPNQLDQMITALDQWQVSTSTARFAKAKTLLSPYPPEGRG